MWCTHLSAGIGAAYSSRQLKFRANKDGQRWLRRAEETRQEHLQRAALLATFPDGDSLFSWIGTIKGASGTVYNGLSYKLSLKFPADYPFKAPTVKFETPCFHPNVDQHGNICLDILKEKWSAAYSVRTVLLSIQSLLGEPNNDSPLNTYAAKLWDQQDEYEKVLRKKYTETQKQ
ncbi:hypothetical protein WJX84_006585 [Apatococcus fuscideae]|uniref:UBC core domain-containing protein n=1 Tax=Apatococcus fuscideae TaxID=2026836 RepID=A0AAW1RZZ2_9CHLO